MPIIRPLSKLKYKNFDTFLIDGTFKHHSEIHTCLENVNFELPKKGEIIHIITNKLFNPVNFIEKIIEIDGEILCGGFATYSINKKAVNRLIHHANAKKLHNINVIFSTMRDNRGENLESAYKILEQSKLFNIAYLYSHTKIIAVRTENNFYTAEMSSNMTENSKIEHITLFNNKHLFDFHNNWISKLTSKYKK